MADKPDETTTPPTPPQAAADKPPSEAPAEPLKGEVSRTGAPGAGVSAARPAGEAKPTPEAEPAGKADQPPAPSAKAPAVKPAAKPAPAPKAPPQVPLGPPDPPPPADTPVPGYVTSLQSASPGWVEQVSFWVGDWAVIVPADRLLEVAQHLRDRPDALFDFCSDVTAVDWPGRPKRFDVVYCLYSVRFRRRLRIKVRAAEGEPVPSVTGIWPAANWLEREVYDLFGVNFTGHPDRRRMLMPEDWQGHPQRKDYPLEGPGELLMENPLDWLRLRNLRAEAEIE